MKNRIMAFAAALVLLSVQGYAQQDTTIVNGVSVYSPKGAILIEPVVASIKGDTAYSVKWLAFGILNSSETGCQTYVTVYNRLGVQIGEFNQPIPQNVLDTWGTDNKVITDYIFLKNPYLKQQ